MLKKSHRTPIVVFGAIVLSAVSICAAAADDNPFARPVAVTVPTNSASVDLLAHAELQGVMTLDGTTVVCIGGLSAKRSRWLAVGAAPDDVSAIDYDPMASAVLLRAGGSTRWIGMRKVAIRELTLPRLEGGVIDWQHIRMTDAEKAKEAEAMLTDMMEVGQLARSGRLKGHQPR